MNDGVMESETTSEQRVSAIGQVTRVLGSESEWAHMSGDDCGHDRDSTLLRGGPI